MVTMSTTTTIPAPLNVKLTKGAAIGFLTVLGAVIATYAKANPGETVLAGIIGAAIGDAVTFLMGSTLSDKWTYVSVNLLLSAVLSTVGLFVGQLVSANVASPMIGAIVGYMLAYVITLLDAPPTGVPTPPETGVPTPPAQA